ncbi:MAG: hypothetical protein MUE44_17160 [Oscillatoriaceae cyanobacterium Prado104]|jgi:hypothetical protein|nr:hypothetical protein [Oscillatoriaceae cyanobacterium Prado104]
MYKVSGKVLVKETGVGIPNLQVVLYDLDIRPAQSSPNEPIEIFNFPNQPAPFFWQAFPGDRLGSVLTSDRGDFELTFDDEDFAAREQVKRPDLIVFVMAPEDSGATNSQNLSYLPKSPLQRILHYSYDPVVNSGKNEGYIIRIPQELLNRFQISYPNLPIEATTTTVESVTANLDASFKFEQGVQATLRKHLQERLKPALDAKKKADEAFQTFTLSKVSPEVRASATYLKPGEKILDKLVNLFDNGLINLPSLDRTAKRKLVLHLTEGQLEEWGLTVSNGTVSGEVSLSEVVEYIRDITGGGTLEYTRPVIENCLKAKKAERLFEEALAKCRADSNGESEEPEPDTETPGIPELTTSSLLREQITRQMKHTTPPEEELKYGVERDGEIIATITKPSPADVTAFHDFHELQIAFEHVWTEIFDKELEALGKAAYEEMVKLEDWVMKDESGNPIVDDFGRPISRIAGVQDMQQMYAEYQAFNARYMASDSVPEDLTRVFGVTNQDWAILSPGERDDLLAILEEYHRYYGSQFSTARYQMEEDAKEILNNARSQASARQSTRLSELMQQLDERLRSKYKFDIFAPNSLNFGILTTYRQKWVPGNYQVGSLISTIPLAPKEIRRYSTKQIIKKSRVQKELDDSQRSRGSEASNTSRADTEIVSQARNKTSFEQTIENNISVGVYQGEFGTRFGVEAEKSSSSTKKNFREAVLKATEEHKQQHRLEIETSVTEELETNNSGEIMNPNDEITVTYLFYDLQRQYEVSERIHRLTPVIFVANEIPAPNEIDNDWLITYEWILRRVILDDSFLPALHYVTTSIAGDELALEILRRNVERQTLLVEELTRQEKVKTNLSRQAFNELKRLVGYVQEKSDLDKLKEINLAIIFGPFSLAGGGGNNEAAEKREEIAKLALERADKETQEVSAKLSREVTALQEAINKYTGALQEHFDRQTAIARLRIHVKENLFYYMQAIWDYEPPDQRFFRLYNVDVSWIELQETTARVRATGNRVGDRDSLRFAPLENPLYEVELSIPITYFRQTTKKLSEVADLDNLLGYKGNYMIFPARQANYLHTYMMQDYIDPHTGGLRDPDEFSNYTTDELLEYACCLQKDAPEVFAAHREYLLNLVKKRMTTPRKESELVVVPTGSVYIEALPGKHPILEDFKLVHRALDVKKVQAEVRNAELENVRFAARLLEGEREDPSIDKHIVVESDKAVDSNIDIDEA